MPVNTLRNIVIIGAGGTASHLIHPLIAYLGDREYMIHIYDADTIEQRNLARQLFYPHEVGQKKVEALSNRFPGKITPHIEYIGPNNIERTIQEHDTALICADNMFIRRLINARAKQLANILVINGGNEQYTCSVQIFLRSRKKNITPALDFYSPEFEQDDGPDISSLSCAEIAALPNGEQTVTANNSAAALMLQALLRADMGTYKISPQWTKITCDITGGIVQTSDIRLIGGIDDRS